jgi:xanthosine utilization system XapX-like protein
MIAYAALLVADVAVIVWVARAGIQGAGFVIVSIIGVIGVLLAYQVLQHARDMRAPLAESEGVVQRTWSRADLIIAWESYYITVERTVFKVAKVDWIDLREGSYVKVVHFPHTFSVVSVHDVLRPQGDPSARI